MADVAATPSVDSTSSAAAPAKPTITTAAAATPTPPRLAPVAGTSASTTATPSSFAGLPFSNTTMMAVAAAGVFVVLLVVVAAVFLIRRRKSRVRHTDLETLSTTETLIGADKSARGPLEKHRPSPLKTDLKMPTRPPLATPRKHLSPRTLAFNEYSANKDGGDSWIDSPTAVASAAALCSPGFIPSARTPTVIVSREKQSLDDDDEDEPEHLKQRRQTMYNAMAKALYSRDDLSGSTWAEKLLEEVMGSDDDVDDLDLSTERL